MAMNGQCWGDLSTQGGSGERLPRPGLHQPTRQLVLDPSSLQARFRFLLNGHPTPNPSPEREREREREYEYEYFIELGHLPVSMGKGRGGGGTNTYTLVDIHVHFTQQSLTIY